MESSAPTPRQVRLKLADLVESFEMGGDILIADELPPHLAGEELRAAVVEASG